VYDQDWAAELNNWIYFCIKGKGCPTWEYKYNKITKCFTKADDDGDTWLPIYDEEDVPPFLRLYVRMIV
jgi:hypothetical protein